MRLFGHVRFDALERVASRETKDRERKRVMHHLASCVECRARFRWVRGLGAEIGAMRAGGLSDGTEQRILRTRREGGRVILPIAGDWAETRPTGIRRALGGVLLVAMTAFGWFAVQEGLRAGPHSGALVFVPAAPRPGDTVRVEYRPGSALEDADGLILRGRTGTGLTSTTDPAPPRVLARLSRHRGKFEGTLTLDRRDAFAQVVVEDLEGTIVDDNGGAFWVLLYDFDGKPSSGALWATAYLANTWSEQRSVVERGVELYPDDPRLQASRLALELAVLTSTGRDSAVARCGELLPQDVAPDVTLTATTLAGLVELANTCGDRAAMARWRDLLVRRFPTHPEAMPYRMRPLEDGDDPVAYLEGLERLWEEGGPHGALTWAGAEAARRAGLRAELERWSSRFLTYPALGSDRLQFLTWLTRIEWARPYVLDVLRSELLALDGGSDERPLGLTVSENEVRVRRRATELLTLHGGLLLADGRLAAAVDTLRHATRLGSGALLYRLQAAALLANGDTTGAAESLAFAAAFPFSEESDGLDVRTGPALVGNTRWEILTRQASDEVRREVLSESAGPGPRIGRARVFDTEGVAYRVDALRRGSVALVARWEPWSGAAVRDIAAMNRVGDLLRAIGAEMIVVTQAEPTSEMTQLIRERGGEWSLYYDADRHLTSLLEPSGAPEYSVVDFDGRVRFHDIALSEAVPIVDALLNETRLTAGTDRDARR